MINPYLYTNGCPKLKGILDLNIRTGITQQLLKRMFNVRKHIRFTDWLM